MYTILRLWSAKLQSTNRVTLFLSERLTEKRERNHKVTGNEGEHFRHSVHLYQGSGVRGCITDRQSNPQPLYDLGLTNWRPSAEWSHSSRPRYQRGKDMLLLTLSHSSFDKQVKGVGCFTVLVGLVVRTALFTRNRAARARVTGILLTN